MVRISALTDMPSISANGTMLTEAPSNQTTFTPTVDEELTLSPTEDEVMSNNTATYLPTIRTMSPTESVSTSSPMEDENSICLVCPDGMAVSDIEKEIVDPTTQKTYLCALIEQRGKMGLMSSSECDAIQEIVPEECGCEFPPPTASPTVAPADAAASPDTSDTQENSAAVDSRIVPSMFNTGLCIAMVYLFWC